MTLQSFPGSIDTKLTEYKGEVRITITEDGCVFHKHPPEPSHPTKHHQSNHAKESNPTTYTEPDFTQTLSSTLGDRGMNDLLQVPTLHFI